MSTAAMVAARVLAAHTPYSLANMVDCALPDSLKSDGAEFVISVAASVRESVEYMEGDDDPMVGDVHTTCAELADRMVPVYTHELWRTFVDLGAWDEDIDDFVSVDSTMEDRARLSLYVIGERLAYALLREISDAVKADQDEEN